MHLIILNMRVSVQVTDSTLDVSLVAVEILEAIKD
jgi:hypothetical protein